jgi:Amino acid synthesis
MKLEARKLVTDVEETFIEGDRAAAKPLKLFGAAAVLLKPCTGHGRAAVAPTT